MNSIQNIVFLLLFFIFGTHNTLFSQNLVIVHSHNDYNQSVPFWEAYSSGATSIEVDIILKNDSLYVAHDEKDIIESRTVESLYLTPIETVLSMKFKNKQKLYLLIDVKTEANASLKKLSSVLEMYPAIIQNKNVKIIISGNIPKASEFVNYPNYMMFDYQTDINTISEEALQKVELISYDFKKITPWNGKGRLTKDDYIKVKSIVDGVHTLGKPIRFWGVNDSKTAWETFVDLGIDFINTDQPYQCYHYVSSLKKRTYLNTVFSTVYNPTFKSDQKDTKVKNVILMIGDGNGLSQISAAVLANNGSLTLTQLKSIGLLKTQSADDFTTDSAAAGTAFATGVKTHNRAIGVDMIDNNSENIAEILQKKNYATGVITTDKITGATPAAFYAHQLDRDMSDKIAHDLLKSNLNLFIGGGKNKFKPTLATSNFSMVSSLEELSQTKVSQVGFFFSDNSVPSVLSGRGNKLAEATANGLAYLNKKDMPFFLMVESSQIDSYAHQNNVSGVVSEGVDFDKAITEAIKFADKNLETLVIIAADHETSGFAIARGDIEKSEIEGDFFSDDHTGTMVPVFAYGPQSNIFTGVYENNELFHKILEVLNAKKDVKF